jgi:hypothetical protein
MAKIQVLILDSYQKSVILVKIVTAQVLFPSKNSSQCTNALKNNLYICGHRKEFLFCQYSFSIIHNLSIY